MSVMHLPPLLLFASDATRVGCAGGALLLLSAGAQWAESRRRHRRRIDAVGWMPWSRLSAAAFLPGTILLLLAAKGWLAG